MNIHAFANLPLHSPYLTQSWSLYIGNYQETYQIHEGVLFRYPELADACRSDSWASTTELLDGCEEICHALIHYLYTGTYEALQPQVDDDKVAELKMITQLYGIAVKYNIPGLSVMLQNQIQLIAKTLNVFDVLGIAQTMYQILSEEDTWFTLFLKKAMEAALMVDKDLFTTSRFLELIGTVKVFDRILMRIVAEIYNRKTAIQARLLQDTIYTPSSSSTSSLNNASREPKSFEEANLYQEVAVPCGELTSHGEAIAPCDEPAPFEEAPVN